MMSVRQGKRIVVVGKYLFLAPAVLAQGMWVKRTIERLPEATGPLGVVGDGAADFEIAAVGDSLAAGVGVATHHESVAALLAARVARQTGRTVSWQVQAQSGLTAAGVREFIEPDQLANCDVIVVSVGANDAKNLHKADRWRTELTDLLTTLRDAAPTAMTVLLGVPPMQVFPALRRPLSTTLGARAAYFDRIADEVCARFERVVRVRLQPGMLTGLFASDGFHPGGTIHQLLAEAIHGELASATLVAPTFAARS